MKAIFQKNPFIVVSIVLPVVLVVLFSATTFLPRLYTDPPSHDLLLVHESWSTSKGSPVDIDFTVVNDQVVARIYRPEESDRRGIPRIFLYDHGTSAVREIMIPIPDDINELPNGAVLAIPELVDLKVSPALKAPDGYEFRGDRSGAGLIVELFGGNQNQTDITIAKDGSITRIRLPASNSPDREVRFLGWVIDQ